MAVPCKNIPDAVKQIQGGDWGVPKAITASGK